MDEKLRQLEVSLKMDGHLEDAELVRRAAVRIVKLKSIIHGMRTAPTPEVHIFIKDVKEES